MDFQFNEECINEHNCLRRLHAQSHAMKLAGSQTVKALGLPDTGENFYLHIGSPSISGVKVVHAWYSEIRSHHFGEERQPYSANFSQMIWKSTRRAGFGRATAHGGCAVFIVGIYKDAGNQNGLYSENVPARLDGIVPPDLGRAGWRFQCQPLTS
ncbi:hypothetical protein EG68_07144 [Paragonimus skrjabini miyazakii]|uniref:SCP domain-containing protein n=1 Tax=Paragonimus skrjabini miyazakii TaxID=59628 RepID=A0A8S9YRL6_9TREM|nr:hypothetical protein EG68_07144 [Paragonimus skrjabini miyazakii]